MQVLFFCTLIVLFNSIIARRIFLNAPSCGAIAEGVSWLDIDHGLSEGIDMARNAAQMMSDAAANPNTDTAKRVYIITQRMLACTPGQGSCVQAQTFYQGITDLKVSQPADYRDRDPDALYVYCDESSFWDDIKNRKGPPGWSQQLNNPNVYMKFCDGHSGVIPAAMIVQPNLYLFCPRLWRKTTRDKILFGWEGRRKDYTGQHIDIVAPMSAIAMHEFAHATTSTAGTLFKDATSCDGTLVAGTVTVRYQRTVFLFSHAIWMLILRIQCSTLA